MPVYQGEKFKQYLERNKISVIQVSQLLNVTRNTVYTYFRSDNLQRETVTNIITSLNTSEEAIWGEQSHPRLEAKPLRLADPHGYDATGEKIYELNDGSLMMEVPIITQRAYAGYLRGFGDPEYYEDLPTLPVMIDRRAFSTYMAFEVAGDSMVNLSDYELAEKSIFPGRIAIGRLLDKSKWLYKLHIHNYDAWVIVHKTEGILIKAIIDHKVDEGEITIHSLNPQYKDEVLKLKDVEQIFSVIKIEQKTR